MTRTLSDHPADTDLVRQGSVIIGQRVPRDYFVTTGVGESDITAHAGSFHLALRQAGIEMCNIMSYSSILPANAREVLRPQSFTHGAVMETILSSADCVHGERATAGLIYGWLHDPTSGRYHGGLVCEYTGPMPPDEVPAHLHDMLDELHVNGYDHLELTDVNVVSRSVTPAKQFGTALVALCFVNHEVPVLTHAH